jgi:hypothetical protein
MGTTAKNRGSLGRVSHTNARRGVDRLGAAGVAKLLSRAVLVRSYVRAGTLSKLPGWLGRRRLGGAHGAPAARQPSGAARSHGGLPTPLFQWAALGMHHPLSTMYPLLWVPSIAPHPGGL